MADNGAGGLSGVAIRRPVFMAMVMLGLVVLGLFAFTRLPPSQWKSARTSNAIERLPRAET